MISPSLLSLLRRGKNERKKKLMVYGLLALPLIWSVVFIYCVDSSV